MFFADAENPKPAEVISMEALCVDNTIRLDYSSSEAALEEPDIGSSDPKITIYNNVTDDELHFGMPGGCADDDDEGDKIHESDAIPTSSSR